MRRYALRDDQWERIEDLLPGREGWVGVTAKDNRLFVEAVLYRYRAGLGEDRGKRMEDLRPGRGGGVGAAAKDTRLFVEAVLYRYRAGIPWRDLPERFGAWKKVHTRFCRWAKTGVWERILRHLAGDADNEYAMIDSTVVRAHQHSAGAVKKAAEATRRSGAAKAA